MPAYYINLTNGIELIPCLRGRPYKFLRIQSTACEQKRWNQILESLPPDFYMDLATGKHCIVFDCGRKGKPRALWQGLEFIRYCLYRCWLYQEPVILGRGKVNYTSYFKQEYNKLPDTTIRVLKYYKKYLITERIYLKTFYKHTTHDGDYLYYRRRLLYPFLRES